MLVAYCGGVFMDSTILAEFYKLSDIEKKQLQDQQFHSDFDTKSILKKKSVYKIPVFTEDFFKNQNIYISKHNRFAAYPTHTHTFLEMNYMLAGHAIEHIGKRDIQLNQGNILILDVGTTHSIEALSANDIMINIIFRNNIEFSLSSIQKLGQYNSIIYKFLPADDHLNKYLIYQSYHTKGPVQVIADAIIEEYFHPQKFSKMLIDSYLRSFLILLSRNTNLYSDDTIQKQIPNLVLYMLKEITKNPRDCNLNKLAEESSYNRAYLGSLFKKSTGLSFSEALTDQRLLDAYNMLISTKMPISEITEQVGISNKTFFYNKFKKKFHELPNDVRAEFK